MQDDPLWDDIVWEQLLENIGRGRVIPIVGPALSVVEFNGKRLTVDRFVAARLAEYLEMPAAGDYALGDVVAEHLRRRRQIDDLYGLINSILARADLKPPPALVRLAEISHFKLFVTTSFDGLLEAAIDGQRFGGERRTTSLGYNPRDIVDCDVGADLNRLTTPIVYHLLGKSSALPEYVISDDDLLEYICALQSGLRPDRLFDALRDHNLLLLGGTFSDWLVRLFLRMAKGQRLSYPRTPLEVMADEGTRSDASLVSFLGNFSLRTRVFDANAPEFIEELHRRWTERFGATTGQGARPAEAPIFLSYQREDAAAAETLRRGLEAKGHVVWFDAGRLKGGQGYDDQIERAIKDCSVFIAVLSQSADRDTQDAYFRREWHLADQRDTRNASDVPFIVPVVVDGSSRSSFRNVPLRFLSKHILSTPRGEVTPDLLDTLDLARRGRRP